MAETPKNSSKKEKWLKIEAAAPAEVGDALSNFLTELGAQGVFQEETVPVGLDDLPDGSFPGSIKAYLPSDIRLNKRMASLKAYVASLHEIFPQLPEIVLATEEICDPDWGESWKKYFKPIRVSRNIVIKPTWERFAPSGRDIVIEIDPGMAFGTGQHASTRLCLGMIEDLLLKDHTFPRWRVLDVGTGTGILGIACAKLGAERVVCADIDKKAVEIARENSEINEVSDRVQILNRDALNIHEPFELIVANLTAKILLKLRNHFLSLLQRNGFLVISGIIDQDLSIVETHFLAPPLSLHNKISEKEWWCYVLKMGENSH